MHKHQRLKLAILVLTLGIAGNCHLLAQHGYEASWKAGLLAADQNPAAIAQSPYQREIVLGAVNLTARNNLFQTDEFTSFLPYVLFEDLHPDYQSLAFGTGINSSDFYTRDEDSWYASRQSTAQVLGVNLRISNPNWIERGLARGVISFGFERTELFQISDVDAPLAQAYANNFGVTGNPRVSDDFFELRASEWNAMTLNLGVSIGRQKKLLHVVIGGKLMSAGPFMQLQAHNNLFTFGPGNTFSMSSDSIRFAYNPSFNRASSPSTGRRFLDFENSWGVAGEIGVIYQIFNYDRDPYLEIGASIQDIGAIQFWNLNHHSYRINNISTDAPNRNNPQTAEVLNSTFSTLAAEEVALGDGITERLPLRITAHAKYRVLKSKLNIHLRGEARQSWITNATWETLIRGTLSWETKMVSIFVPFTYSQLMFSTSPAITREPELGVFISFGEIFMIGSNDLLSSAFYSATRKGVTSSNLFLGLRIPVKSDF